MSRLTAPTKGDRGGTSSCVPVITISAILGEGREKKTRKFRVHLNYNTKYTTGPAKKKQRASETSAEPIYDHWLPKKFRKEDRIVGNTIFKKKKGRNESIGSTVLSDDTLLGMVLEGLVDEKMIARGTLRL